MPETRESFSETLIEVGKVFVDRQGAGRIYVPKNVVSRLGLVNKDHMKLEVNAEYLKAKAIKRL